MNKLLSILLTSFLLYGCDNIETPFKKNNDKSSIDKESHIGVLMSNAIDNPFFSKAFQAFQAYGNDHENIKIISNDAHDNQQSQFEALDKMIASGVQAIIINMVDTTQSSVVIDKAKSAGIPVVFFNRNPGENILSTYNKALFIGSDDVQGAVLQGLDVLNKWKTHSDWDKNNNRSIEYAMLMGIPTNPGAQARTKWSTSTMKSYPQLGVPIKEVTTETAMFKENLATDIVTDWINDGTINNIEVILANNDTMAIGAIKALEEAQLSVPVFGIDAIPAAVEMLNEGRLSGTVINDATEQAEVSILSAINLAYDQPTTQGLDYHVEYQTILVPYKSLND